MSLFGILIGAPSKGISGVATSKKDDNKESKDARPDDKRITKTMLVLSGGEGYIDFRIGWCYFLTYSYCPILFNS